MNDERRQRLRDAIRLLDNASGMIQRVCDSEEDSMDNVPENLQGSERYERMEETVDALSDAVDGIEEVRDKLRSVI